MEKMYEIKCYFLEISSKEPEWLHVAADADGGRGGSGGGAK